MTLPEVSVYTDGACSGNPGPGGWGAVLLYKEHRREISGYTELTTNNRMELQGAISALARLLKPCRVTLHSDSTYLCDAFNKGWLRSWQGRGWLKADKTPVENQDLWQELLALTSVHKVTFVKVPGHADNAENNRCDALARAAIKSKAGTDSDTDADV